MRILFACLLALILSFNPLAGFAVAADCEQAMAQPMASQDSAKTMASADIAGMKMSTKEAPSKTQSGAPCCDHKMKDCAKACAAMGAVTTAILPMTQVVMVPTSHRIKSPVTHTAGASFKPPQLDPPPRTLA